MFQDYTAASGAQSADERLKELQALLVQRKLGAFLIPRGDAHRGEVVPPKDERLAWLTGFTGSDGLAVVAQETAALFVDGRYTLQAEAQVPGAAFVHKNIPNDTPEAWLETQLGKGDILAYDPWLQTQSEIDRISKALMPKGIKLEPTENLIDQIWSDRPGPPAQPIKIHPLTHAGKRHAEKLAETAETVSKNGCEGAVLTLPDSIAWLLNIRGSDIGRTPVPLCFAILHRDGTVDLFYEPGQCSPEVLDHLGPSVRIHDRKDFESALKALRGKIQIDRTSAPIAVRNALEEAEPHWARDPCVLPKACKNEAELTGAKAAHGRDAIAVTEFLAWLAAEAPEKSVTEIDAARKLEEARRATNLLQDISFETISGSGPNGAIVHYRVTEATNRKLAAGELYLVDSGGQYLDGTTDITRTVAIGTPPAEAKTAFTAVLKGMIAISRLRFPDGIAGRDIDGFARAALWHKGLDYDHGTGHGVGSYLSVHEGPASISRRSVEPLRPGMILSNEPGYYETGSFGIRIENLIVVNAPEIPAGGTREMLSFDTLTYVPIDKNLISVDDLIATERDWLNSYHSECRQRLSGHLSAHAETWMQEATQAM